MKHDYFEDDELMDYVDAFEGALGEVLEEIPEFHDLMDFIKQKQGNISLYMGVQVIGEKPSRRPSGKKKTKKGLIRNVPLKFEFSSKDKKFLKKLRIDCCDL